MKKNFLNIFTLALLACGSIFFASCEKEEDSGVRGEKAAAAVASLDDVNAMVQEAYAKLTFDELVPLRNSIRSNTARVLRDNGNDEEMDQNLRDRFVAFLNHFIPVETTPHEYGRSFDINLFGDMFSATYEFSGVIALASKTTPFYAIHNDTYTLHINTEEALYDVNFYTNYSHDQLERGLQSSSVDQITIYKDGEFVMSSRVVSSFNWTFPTTLSHDIILGGELIYNDILITLDFSPEGLNAGAMNFSMYQNESEIVNGTASYNRTGVLFNSNLSTNLHVDIMGGILSISAGISDISSFLNAAIPVFRSMETGTTEAACVEYANSLNEVMAVRMFLSGSNIGTSRFGVRYDEELEAYNVVLEISSPIWDNRYMTLDEFFMEMSGLTFGEYIKSLLPNE